MPTIKDTQITNSGESLNSAPRPVDRSFTIYDVLMLFIGICSALAIVMIAVNQFYVPVLVGCSVVLTLLLVILGVKRVTFKDERFASKTFILILAAAMLFRIGAFTYYSGGQDEGLYVNLSGTLVANHGVNIYDAFRASLPEDLRIIYDKTSFDASTNHGDVGINLVDTNKSIAQIRFYPLNGVWLAISEAIFGLGKHGYAIQFFSLLVVIGIYLLTLELTNGNRKAATLAMLFAALNPAIVFFSKFPVSETLAMAFSLNGFYLLIKGLKSTRKRDTVFLLAASAVLLGLFNLVRMSFVVFLPTLAVILIVVFLFSDLRKYRYPVTLFVVGVAILYGLTWLYYYFIQPPLGSRTINLYIAPFLKESLPLLFVLVIIGIILVRLADRSAEKVERAATWIVQKAQNISTWIIPIALSLSIIRVIHSYNINPSYNFRLSDIYNFMLLISPFSFVLIFALPFLKIRFSRIQLILILTITVAWMALFVGGFANVAYKYYYTRYITSEVLLYSIILVAIGLSFLLEREKKYRAAATVTIVITALYFCLFSSVQIGRAETENPQMDYALNSLVGRKDVIVSYLDTKRSTPLKYYFGKNVFQLGSLYDQVGNSVLMRLYDSGAYDNVYILSDDTLRNGYESYGWEQIGQYNYEFSYFTDGYHAFSSENVTSLGVSQFFLPIKYIEENHIVYLYKLTRSNSLDVSRELDINCGTNGNLGTFVEHGFSFSEPDHTWTNDKTAALRFKLANSGSLSTDLNFSMEVQGFTNVLPYQRVTIYANSQEVYTGNIGGEASAISFPIPAALVRGQDTLEIKFALPDASASKTDPRVLGLAFSHITIMPSR